MGSWVYILEKDRIYSDKEPKPVKEIIVQASVVA